MKNLEQEMLDSGTLCFAWKLLLTNGEQFGFTDHDEDFTFDELLYQASSGFTASAIESGLGLKVDNLEVEGALSAQQITEGDIHSGKLDGAEIFIYRLNWKNVEQRALLRRGNIGEIVRTEHGFRVELRGLAHKLTYPQGRVYQKQCDADFTDERCKVHASIYTSTGRILSVEQDNNLMVVSIATDFAANYFSFGKMTFTSGANQGLSFEIRTHDKTNRVSLLLWESPPNMIEVGDEISLLAGCNKTFTTCKNKFNNQLNFQGFPHLPGNDYMQYYPRS